MNPFKSTKCSCHALPIVISSIGILLSAIAFNATLGWENQKLRASFERAAEDHYSVLKRKIEFDLHVLDSVKAFYLHGHRTSRSDFGIL